MYTQNSNSSNIVQPDRLAEIEARLKAWFAAKYPDGVTDFALLSKFNEECDEYLLSFDTSNTAAMIVEAADVCIVLFNTAAHFGHSLGDAILAKLAVIERRLTEPSYGREGK